MTPTPTLRPLRGRTAFAGRARTPASEDAPSDRSMLVLQFGVAGLAIVAALLVSLAH